MSLTGTTQKQQTNVRHKEVRESHLQVGSSRLCSGKEEAAGDAWAWPYGGELARGGAGGQATFLVLSKKGASHKIKPRYTNCRNYGKHKISRKKRKPPSTGLS